MGENKNLKWLKRALLLGGLVLFVYLLMPSRELAKATDDTITTKSAEKNAQYVIRVSAGSNYHPGSRPFGMGEPLTGFSEVIREFETRYPDTRIEVVNVSLIREYLVTQLSSENAPDVVWVNVEDVWVDTQKGWYIPLDNFLNAPNPFVAEKNDPNLPGAKQWWDMFRYQAVTRGKAAPDGKNYCLTLSMIETGIFYNKTIFDELGLQPPETWEEWLDICKKIKNHFKGRKIPLLMEISSFSDWSHDLLFDQLYYNLLPGIDLKQDPEREEYLQGYLDPEEIAFLNTKGFFTERDPRYRDLWRIMKELKNNTNRDVGNLDCLREFVTQRGVMYWASSQLTYRLILDKNLDFEWGVFYLPKLTKKTSKYASGTEMCVIGGAADQYEVTNSAINDTPKDWPMAERMAKSEKLKRVILFLQFLSLPEQWNKVVNEYPSMIPNIIGIETKPELAYFERILKRRYTTTKWLFSFDLRFEDILNRMLSLYLADNGIELDEFLQWQVNNVDSGCKNLKQRKEIDFTEFERKWQELKPIRDGMIDLPAPSK